METAAEGTNNVSKTQKGKTMRYKILYILTLIAILAGSFLGGFLGAQGTFAAGCPTIGNVTPQMSVGNCHYVFMRPTTVTIPAGWFADLYNTDTGLVEWGLLPGEERNTNELTLKPLSAVQGQITTQPAGTQPATQLGQGQCWVPDPNDLFIPNDSVQAARLFLGDANRASEIVRPEPDRLPHDWVFRTSEKSTCVLNPGWVIIFFNVGKGDETHQVPGFLTVAGGATFSINNEIAPTR